jgi:cytochrome c oxidase assembly protein subunit 15
MSENALSTSSASFVAAQAPATTTLAYNVWLARFAKFVVFSTLVLIFFGGQVKSHEAGLAVPDWPLTYGHNPITFPIDQWKGGVFHEHFHRLFAGVVMLASVALCVWVLKAEQRGWLRKLAVAATIIVLVQAFLGGMTVWYQLPLLISGSHGTLAQTFLLLNVILAYGLSRERAERKAALAPGAAELRTPMVVGAVALIALLYCQLLLGAVTRHTESGLAIPDFPTVAGQWIPAFNAETLEKINTARMGMTDAVGTPLDPVAMHQVVVHFLHRAGAVVVTCFIAFLAWLSLRFEKTHPQIMTLAYLLCGTVVAQFVLGMTIVMTQRSPFVASLHVAVGAATLALAGLLALRAWPLKSDNAV